MPAWVLVGRRRDDFGLVVNFHKHRAMVRANTKWIDGKPLEEIAPDANQRGPGMVLIHKDWKNIYFLNEREKWEEEDYFQLACKIMKERGILKP